MSDPWNDPEVKKWVQHIKTDLEPMISDSKIGISLCPPRSMGVDTKFAVELGYLIMLDKPILVVAETNDDVPPKLRKVADVVLIGHHEEPGFNQRLVDAIQRLDAR